MKILTKNPLKYVWYLWLIVSSNGDPNGSIGVISVTVIQQSKDRKKDNREYFNYFNSCLPCGSSQNFSESLTGSNRIFFRELSLWVISFLSWWEKDGRCGAVPLLRDSTGLSIVVGAEFFSSILFVFFG